MRQTKMAPMNSRKNAVIVIRQPQVDCNNLVRYSGSRKMKKARIAGGSRIISTAVARLAAVAARRPWRKLRGAPAKHEKPTREYIRGLCLCLLRPRLAFVMLDSVSSKMPAV